MTKQRKGLLWVLLLYVVVTTILVVCFSSCTAVRKSRSVQHQESVKTENTQKTDIKDSTTKTITKTVDSSGITVTVVYDSTTSDTAATFDIITYPPSKDQYTERISVKSSVKPKSITVTQAKKKQAERLDSTTLKNRVVENARKYEKIVFTVKTAEKKKFKISGFMIGIGLAVAAGIVLVIKNRKKIWEWVKRVFSLIKFL